MGPFIYTLYQHWRDRQMDRISCSTCITYWHTIIKLITEKIKQCWIMPKIIQIGSGVLTIWGNQYSGPTFWSTEYIMCSIFCLFLLSLCPAPVGWDIMHWWPSSACPSLCPVPDPKSRMEWLSKLKFGGKDTACHVMSWRSWHGRYHDPI